MTLADLKIGQVAEISGYLMGSRPYRAKLLALGLTCGIPIKLINIAPLGDPLELAVRGYHLSLRKNEAKILKVKPILVSSFKK